MRPPAWPSRAPPAHRGREGRSGHGGAGLSHATAHGHTRRCVTEGGVPRRRRAAPTSPSFRLRWLPFVFLAMSASAQLGDLVRFHASLRSPPPLGDGRWGAL